MGKETFAPWDSAEFLTNDETIIEYLQAAVEENDPAFFMKAVGNVARAKGRRLLPRKHNWAARASIRPCPVSVTHVSAP